jgi:hypothetical protein
MADQGGYDYDGDDFDDDGYADGYDFDFEDDGLEPAEGAYGGSADYGDDGEELSDAETAQVVDAHLARIAAEAVQPHFDAQAQERDHLARALYEQAVEERRAEEADAIEDRYEALRSVEPGDPGDVLQDAVLELASREAEALGHPELVRWPKFFEQVFLAHREELGELLERAQSAAIETRMAEAHPSGRTQRAMRRAAEEAEVEQIRRMNASLDQPGDSLEDRMVAAYAKSGRHRLGG